MILPGSPFTAHLPGGHLMQAAEFLFKKAEQCFLLAKHAERSCSANNEIPAELEFFGNELMTKAVEIEATRQKTASSI